MRRILILTLVFAGVAVPAAAEPQPQVSTSAMDDAGFDASIPSAEGSGKSYSRRLPSSSLITGAEMEIWKAEPGIYRKPAVKEVETFIIVEGSGTIRIENVGEIPLKPGTIITIPPGAAASMTVERELRKFSVITNRN